MTPDRYASPLWSNLLFLISLIVVCGQTAAAEEKGGCADSFSIGFEIVALRDGRQAAVWYPSAGEPAKYSYAQQKRRGFFGRQRAARGLATKLAKGGEASNCGPFPLVVFSHGLAGCGTQTLFFTEELARRGYVVAAPDHEDAGCSVDGSGTLEIKPPEGNLFDPASWTDQTYAGRRDDLQLLLQQMLASEKFGPMIDADRIGAVGHSVGGYTALGMAGAWPSWNDDRIKAVLLFSPYALPFTAQSTLGGVDIPVMYQGAEGDFGITPFVEGPDGAFVATGSPRYFVKLRGGTHFEWTNFLCLGDATIEDCLNTSENARLINAYGFAFLDRYLKDKESPLLLSNGEGLNHYERVSLLTTVSAANFATEIGVAPESIATGFSEGMTLMEGAAQSVPLPVELNNLSFKIVDSSKAIRSVPLLFVSPKQANLVIPNSTALGAAIIQAFLSGQIVAEGTLTVNASAPAVFSANGSGQGLAAATVTRVASSGASTSGLTFDPVSLTAIPVDVGVAGEEVYLSVFGTGMRSLQAPLTARVGGSVVAVAGPVPHSQFIALDQVNLGPLPSVLGGLGEIDIELAAGDVAVNTTTVVTQ